jgi:hypothetical protein
MKKVANFLIACYHTNFQDLTLYGASVVPTSEVRTAVVFVFSVVRDLKIPAWWISSIIIFMKIRKRKLLGRTHTYGHFEGRLSKNANLYSNGRRPLHLQRCPFIANTNPFLKPNGTTDVSLHSHELFVCVFY